jgi:hypothetical protein
MPWTRQVSYSVTYSIGDEPSSSNYRPDYCNKCDADTPDQCRCDYSSCSTADDYIHHQQRQQGDVCRECGHDYSYRFDFSDSGVQTSIDIIFSELLMGLGTSGKREKKMRCSISKNDDRQH